MVMESKRAKPAFAALLVSVVAVLAAGCGGGDDDGDGRVSIYANTGPKGAPSLVKGDAASGTQDQRVPITPKGTPVAIYQEPVRELTDGMHLRAIASVTLTKCAITDYMPNQRAHTACQGTRHYTWNPVEIETQFRLVGGDSAPDLSGPGISFGPKLKLSCTTAIHHCSIARDFETDYDPEKLKGSLDAGDVRWIVLEATASSPKAASCAKPSPSKCDVLAVETQKGQAMYWVQSDASLPETPFLPSDHEPNVKTLDVLTNHGDKNAARRVVFSAKMGPGEPIDDILGRQVEVDSMLKIGERVPQAPDIAGYLVLADSPTSIHGRYLISDSYDPGKTGNDGGNCDTRCTQARPAVATSIQQCDIDAGRRYLNLVADASRAAAKKGEKVKVTGGFLEVTRGYLPENSIDTGAGDRGCGS
jgi:hypothetical protein